MESFARGNKGENNRGWDDGMVETIFIRTWREGQAKGEKSSTGSEQWIKDEREESKEWIYCDPAVLWFCFFSADTVNMEGAGSVFFFYRSHATSQWCMDAGPLQTYTVEHALCGSAKRGHLGKRGSTPLSLSLLPSMLSTALLPIISAQTSSQLLSSSPTLPESLLKMV